AAIRACSAVRWRGTGWRTHSRQYPATSLGGARTTTGRYHRGPDLFPPDQCFAALYLGLTDGVAHREAERHLSSDNFKRRLQTMVLSEVECHLEHVRDCRDVDRLSVTADELLDDLDLSVGQALG